MTRQTLVLATLFAIGGAVVAALLMHRGRDADESKCRSFNAGLKRWKVGSRRRRHRAACPAPSSYATRVRRRQACAIILSCARIRARVRCQSNKPYPRLRTPLPSQSDVGTKPECSSRHYRRSRSTWPRPIRSRRASSRPSADNRSSLALSSSMPSAEPRCAALPCSSVATRTWTHSLAVSAIFQASKTLNILAARGQSDGSSMMTMYVVRQGHKLPDYQMHAAD